MAIQLVPNVINADVFDVQADARDGRFTWQRINGKNVRGMIIAGKPLSLQWAENGLSYSPSIDQSASMDDVNAWAFAARWWISFAWQQYADAADAWMQLDWAGSASPDSLLPTAKSLVNGASFGVLEVFGENPPWLLTGSWTQYFTSLVAQVVAQSVQFRVSSLIQIQIAMRSVAMMMQSIVSAGPDVQRSFVDTCDTARAWQAKPTFGCEAGKYLKMVDSGNLGAVSEYYKFAQPLVADGTVDKPAAWSMLDEIIRRFHEAGGSGTGTAFPGSINPIVWDAYEAGPWSPLA